MLLTWVYGNTARVIYEGDVRICQSKKTELKRQASYKGGYFQIRTEIGFKKVPILLNKKNKNVL